MSSPSIPGPADDELVGKTLLDRYRVTARLWQGSSGAAYKALQDPGGQKFIIRVFPPEVGSDANTARRFEHDARELTALVHPNIISISDYGVTPTGRRFLATPSMLGLSLRQLIAKYAPMEPTRACAMLMQMARALVMAQPRGVMHGNLKPDSVMVQREQRRDVVRVLDFGVAHLTRLAPNAPRTVMGTPRYMAPEQIQGHPDEPRSDIYALGVIFFEMLTGTAPFDAPEGEQIVRKHLEEKPPALKDRPLKGPASHMLEELVAQMLRKDPAQRPGHADLLEAVEALPEYINPELDSAELPLPRAPLTDEDPTSPALSLEDVSAALGEDGPRLELAMSPRDLGGPGVEGPALGLGGPGIAIADRPPSREMPLPRARGGGVDPRLVAGGAAGLALLVGVVAFWPSSSSPPPEPVEEQPVAAPAPSEPSAEVDVEGMRLVARKKAAPPPSKPAAAPAPTSNTPAGESRLIKLSVTSDPPGAQVLEGPIPRGVTPAQLVLPRGNVARTLTLHLDGHDDVTRVVIPEKDGELHVKLTPRAAAPAPSEKGEPPVEKPVEARAEEARPVEPRVEEKPAPAAEGKPEAKVEEKAEAKAEEKPVAA
ncbi:MAG: serine/threonine-protein kinase, partial [Myxococcota bacterium]